ncbi:FapA family protein [Mesobacillus jeotgali]|uniref:FapA family protein n=1 Tax=Mesobacillus jeotgali TaxID=129985 RepID=A0ABY9VNR5_9BACI|nr:FapA family protein [Mesobacillus jeotgali]WNF24502.1 FapA family protein [Mesobacillus jeotgali]
MATEYKVKLSHDRLTADLILDFTNKELAFSADELFSILKAEKIVFGVKTDVLAQISENPFSFEYPVTIAVGEPKVDGADAYLRNELHHSSPHDHKVFNFRSVLQIPSVRKGQLLASVVSPTNGAHGTDVTGRIIPAKPGRPLRVKPGKNVLFESAKFFATCDGQVSITEKAISVNPVFEVKGDLDLKIGNIDFVGNISIKGNVPSGYELKAGGDIIVDGLVEAANLQAEGNIIIKGGVAGAMKGKVTAGGSVLANYLNQANVKSAQDIIVKSSILHSKVTASGNVDCRTGTIIGGVISAGRNIFVKELGNELFTKTELAVGWDPLLEKAELETIQSIETAKDNIRKLTEIEVKLAEIGNRSGGLAAEQQQMILKQRNTRRNVEAGLSELLAELEFLQHEKQDRLYSSLFVFDRVFPNTKVFFGKYAFLTNQLYKKVGFHLENSEISIQPIVEKENH